MSLVAYGSSDESENEDECEEQPQIKTSASAVPNFDKNENLQPLKKNENSNEENSAIVNTQSSTIAITSTKLNLPVPKVNQNQDIKGDNTENSNDDMLPNFNALPKPMVLETLKIKEADSALIPKKINYDSIEMPLKKKTGPAKISIPSLSDFKDLEEEEDESKRYKIKPSKKGSGLISILPPTKGSAILTKTTTMIPNVLTKKPIEPKQVVSQSVNKTVLKKPFSQQQPSASNFKSLSNYNSDSEDDDDQGTTDFFSLSTPAKISDDQALLMSSIDTSDIQTSTLSMPSDKLDDNLQPIKNNSNKVLKNNIMDISKEEIILKNKAEVGPKLPVPEQEYHLDSEGNVAFDERAIEYLCGKRGVKRKNELSNIDIVEISGDDIKPDEREWLVKALTEEQVHRPLSVNSGPGGQSKKKHQITYLAHQAKSMELELKNQWAQSKANRQATRSKYGF